MSAEIIRLRFDDDADVDRWHGYVRARPDSHYTDLAGWRRLYRALYGFEDYSYAFVEGGRVAGVASLYHIRSPLMGRMLVTNPFFGSGGFYWDDDAARDALAQRILADAAALKLDYVELRLRQRMPAPFGSNDDFAEYDLPLEPDTEATWSGRLSSNVRQNIRKARKQPLEFRLTDDHRPCYDLLRRTLRAHGTPFHGERFFHLLRAHLGGHVRYSEVRHEGRLVAGGIVVTYERSIGTPYIGSLARYRALRPNYLQYWKLIEDSVERGIERFEMGRSPRGSTHARFKMKWGCEEVDVPYGYKVVDPRKRYRSVSRPSAMQRLAAGVWKRMPLGLTTMLGPRLFRYVP